MSKAKTPLQRWARERFELKRSVIGIRTRLSQLAALYNTTSRERRTITKAREHLGDMMEGWDESHRATKIIAREQ